MVGRWDHSHHVDQRPPEDGIVGELDIEDTELCDNVERIRADWEFDCVGGTSFTPVKTVEERLCPGVDQLSVLLWSVLHST